MLDATDESYKTRVKRRTTDATWSAAEVCVSRDDDMSLEDTLVS